MLLCRYLILISLIITIHSRPVEEEENDDPLNEHKKIKDEDVKQVIGDLESLINKLPVESLEGDTILHQVVDTLNGVTFYKGNGTGKKDPSIYERHFNDQGKKAIVLNPSEDKITIRKAKKTFVGLKHTGEGSKYHVFYIYVRDATSSEEGSKLIGNEHKIVEYDSWENREDKLQKVSNGFGWNDCSSSIFIPCKTNEKTGFAKPRVDHRKPNKGEGLEIFKEKKQRKEHKVEGVIKTESGLDSDENVDFFWDLEDDIQKARFIGVGLDLLSGGLGGIPNLLTGVFGGITEGVGGLLSGVLGTAGQLLSGVLGTGVQLATGIAGGATQALTGLVGAASSMVSSGLGGLLGMFGGGADGGGGIGGGFGAGINVAVDLGSKFFGGMVDMVGQGMNLGMGMMNQGMNVGMGMLNQGMSMLNTGMSLGTNILGAGSQMLTGALGGVMKLVTGLFQAGLGLVNSLLSFGGLGSAKATVDSVGSAIGINLGTGGRQMSADYDQNVQQGIQRPQSGGLGGLLSLDVLLGATGEAVAAAVEGVAGSTGEAASTDEAAAPSGSIGQDGRGIDAKHKGTHDQEGHGTGEKKHKAIDPQEGRVIGGKHIEHETSEERRGRGILTLKIAEVIAKKMGENFGLELLKTGLMDHPGWKTMDESGEPGNMLSHEDDAFVGFGGCDYQKVTKEDYKNTKTATDVISILTKALRTQCVQKEAKLYDQLIADNFLKLNSDKTFDVPDNNKYLKMEKLNPHRRSDLSRAFQMSLFSKSFKAELESKEMHDAPEHAKISRRTYTFGEVVTNGIELAGKEFKHHEIKILRSLLTTLKAAFTKLVQDHEVTVECDQCKKDLEINKNDQHYLMSLMEFIVHGLAPVYKKNRTVKEAFTNFNDVNDAVISNRVEGYIE